MLFPAVDPSGHEKPEEDSLDDSSEDEPLEEAA